MSNKAKGEIALELDKPRVWKLNMNDMCSLESILEVRRGHRVSFIDHLAVAAQWTTEDWRQILWAGLKHEDKTLTEEQLGGFLDMYMVLDFKAKLLSEWLPAMVPESLKKIQEYQKARVEEAANAAMNGTPPGAGSSK